MTMTNADALPSELQAASLKLGRADKLLARFDGQQSPTLNEARLLGVAASSMLIQFSQAPGPLSAEVLTEANQICADYVGYVEQHIPNVERELSSTAMSGH